MHCRFVAVLFIALVVAQTMHAQTAAPKPADPLTPVRARLPAAKLGPPHTQAVPQTDDTRPKNPSIPYYTPPFVPTYSSLPPSSRESMGALAAADTYACVTAAEPKRNYDNRSCG